MSQRRHSYQSVSFESLSTAHISISLPLFPSTAFTHTQTRTHTETHTDWHSLILSHTHTRTLKLAHTHTCTEEQRCATRWHKALVCGSTPATATQNKVLHLDSSELSPSKQSLTSLQMLSMSMQRYFVLLQRNLEPATPHTNEFLQGNFSSRSHSAEKLTSFWVKQSLFLSAAIGQRPRNYLSCCSCSCSPFGSFPH